MTNKPHIVLPMQPTPNGRLHIGHIAGPYLRADMLLRRLRRDGENAVMVCGADVYENWVVHAAQKAGVGPQVFAHEMSENILGDLKSVDIVPDVWVNPLAPEHCDPYRKVHERLLTEMVSKDSCEKRVERIPRSSSGKYVVGTWIAGKCPTCRANVAGNSCTVCGAGFQPSEIIDPVSRMDSGPLAWIEKESWFARGPESAAIIGLLRKSGVNDGMLDIVSSQLDRSGSWVRVSQPGDWGVKSDLVDADCVLTNTFYAYCVYCAERAAVDLDYPQNGLSRDVLTNVTALFGKDNANIGLVAPAVLSSATAQFRLFDAIAVNYLLHFEGQKCSTSKRHGIWINELLASTDIDSDELRFCLSEIDLSKADQNVSVDGLIRRVNWLRNWRREVLLPVLAGMDGSLTAKDHATILAAIDEQAGCLSPARVVTAEAASQLVSWMSGSKVSSGEKRFAWVTGLALLAAPIMPRLASLLWAHLGPEGTISFEKMITNGPTATFAASHIDKAPLSAQMLRGACHLAGQPA